MKEFLRILLRKISRKPVYSAITFAGFTLAIAAALLIYLWILYENGYEKFHPDYNRIYRVLTLSRQGDEIVKSPCCYRPVAATLKMDYPQIEKATYISYDSESSPVARDTGGEKSEVRICRTNEDFFSIFRGFRFVEGSPESAFKNPDNAVISEEVARKLFGKERAVGKTLVSDKYSRQVYTIGGVVSIPEQSHLNFDLMLSDHNSLYSAYSNSWSDKGFVRVYLKLARDAQISDQFLTSITNHISRYSRIKVKLMFQPLTEIHLHSDYPSDIFDRNPGNYAYVLIFTGLALLVILMASLNYSVLSVAGASERIKEIAIRKSAGAKRAGIFGRFIAESILHISVSSAAALILVWLILPWFNSIISKPLILAFTPELVLNLLLLTLSIGFISGIYPSLYLSSFSPVFIFRRGSLSGSKASFIRVLVTVQFSLAIFFIIVSLVFIRQIRFIHKKDLGLNGKNIVVVPTGLWYDNKQFKDELVRNPNVLSVSASVTPPVDFVYKQSIPLDFKGGADTLQASLFWADEDFARTYDLKLVRGEFLKMDNTGYWKEYEKTGSVKQDGTGNTVTIPAVINETAEKMMGMENIIGKRIGDNVIVGVVKDFNFRPLQNSIGPLIITNNPETIQTMNIKIAPDDIPGTLRYIKEVYRKNRENRDFSYSFFEDLLDEKYEPEIRLRNITEGFSLVAILISILGILGMTIFSIDRRTKEIGIRRISGASPLQILIMINSRFMIWVIAAFVLVSPVAWLVLKNWLTGFAYKAPLSWWIFLVAGSISGMIALLTVSWQSWRAATRNPVEALRYE